MLKDVLRRFLSLIMCFIMVSLLLPATAMAKTSMSLPVDGLSAEFNTGANEWQVEGGNNVKGAIKPTEGGCDSSKEQTTTLTLKNIKGKAATLMFEYTLTLNGGTALIKNTTVDKSGKYSFKLNNNDTIEIEIRSAGEGTNATTIELKNIQLVDMDTSASVTFIAAENGYYTVDGERITQNVEKTKSASEPYKLVATPNAGFKFDGWYSNDVLISKNQNTELHFDSNKSFTAKFTDATLPEFDVDGKRFDDLNDAVAYATGNEKNKIVLVGDGILKGQYTIPVGITLLIPFDEAKTLYTDTPKAITSKPVASPFRTLTMAAGSSITLESGAAISVGGQYYAASGGAKGHIVGPYGYIKMEYGSAITVKNGGKLYAWGFISGSGSVTVESGGFVYEWYQILDFRGGSASSEMGNGVFPFSQYAVQNVEVPMTLYAGASETAYTAVYAIRQINPTSMPFIGDNGLFKVASGSLTKAYDGTTDRIIYTVNGTAEVNSLNLKLAGMSVSSSSYVLPFTNNMTVNLNSGSKLTVNQTAALLPGIEATIANDAELVVSSGKSIYIYDVDEWGGYCGASDAQFIPVVYAPGRTGKRPPLADAKVDVNGKLTAIGGIYTTESGADICSSEGTGVYLQQGAPGTETKTYQYTQTGSVTAHEIPITSAKLHNADGSYTETAAANAGDVINYVNGVWGGEPAEYTITFDANGSEEYPVEGTMEPQTVPENTETELAANAFTRGGHNFTGWNTAADGSGTAYADKATVKLTDDTTLYAQWEKQKFTVTWKNGDTVLKTEELEYGTKPEYTGEIPTKAGDEQYNYEFNGWTPEIAAVTGDAEYTARFTETPNEYTITFDTDGGTEIPAIKQGYGTAITAPADPTKTGHTFAGWDKEIPETMPAEDVTITAKWTVNQYTVTWLNDDESVLKTEQVNYGTIPSYGENPTKPATAQYTYTFKGWDKEIVEVTENVTYTAVFDATVNTYTVTWVNEDGTELKKDENVEYGTTPEYNGETPTRSADAQYTYTFTGWTPEITAVTGDVTYTAHFTETVNKYTVTWVNEDGTELKKDENVDYGEKPKYTGATPTKAGDEQYTYTFKGWTPEITAVTGDVTYTAVFEKTVNEYTVTWKNYDGSELRKDTLEYGEMPEYKDTPTKPATAQYTYMFTGWTPAVAAVTGNATYTAQFTETVRMYTITWIIDGKEETTDVAYGAMPTHAEPTKDTDEHYSYEFSGWQPAITDVSGDATYTATFTSTPVEYTITFDTDGGTHVKPITKGYGKEITAPAAPTKTGYTFAGWDKDIPTTMPAENMTITAKWTVNKYTITFETDGGSDVVPITQDYGTEITKPAAPTKTGYTFIGWSEAIPATMPAKNMTITAKWNINQYTITFDTDGGSTIESITQDYGTAINAPADPTKTGYVFDGWENDIPTTMPAENLSIKAKWKAKTYNITWIVDGQEPITTEAEYNTLPSYGENVPTKTATAEYTYEFIDWKPEIVLATEDATYTAEFREVPNIYTITWNVDGTKTNDSFAYDAAITAPADPTKEGYTFTGWMIAEDEVLPATMPAKNIVATAQWAKNKYKLTFVSDGYEWEPADVEWEADIYAPAGVSKVGHTLEGWYYTDGDEEKKFNFEADKMPMHDMTLTAKWTINQYTITFDTDGGSTIEPITQDYDTVITAPEVPTKDGYTFKEWSPALPETMPADDMIVTAIYDYTYTGWITDEKGKTYLENGEKKYYQKWATIEGQEYYFNVEGYVVTGWQELDKDGRSTLFVFDDAGVFQNNMNGAINTKNDATGDIYWVVNGGVVKDAGLVRVAVTGGGVYYYFDPEKGGKAFKGSVDEPQCKVVNNNGLKLPAGNNYKFGSDGIIEHFEYYPNGIYQSGGDYYYCVDGVIIANGLMQIDGYYYYAKTSTGAFVCSQSYWITKTNDLPLKEGIYQFDEQGRIVFPEDVEVKNGIVAENGDLYYYVDGKLTGAGLIQIEGDYYYVKTSNGEVVHDRDYWITATNNLLPAGQYEFAQDGKMINPPVVDPNPDPNPEVKNGIVEERGSLYYYVDGKLTGAGLIQIEGDYYYVKTSNCEVVHDRKYWITVTNNLLPAGQYKFAQDGKMVR